MTTNAYEFKAEVQQLLQILVHSLYKDREIFVRELVSNASDALTRFHFETLTNRDVLDPDAELAIHVEVPETEEGEPKTIIIKDSGIGMTREELVQNLGTIAQSGARDFLKKLQEVKDGDPSDVIGQFGVGFYSVFMIAEEVKVVSRSYQLNAEAAAWVSDGSNTYNIEDADKADRGTEIHITLKKDAEEFASGWRLKQIIKKHSDFVRYAIYVDGDQANSQESLWRKSPSEVEDDEYNRFYQQMSMDFEAPLLSIHFRSDAPVNLRSMLFVPAKRDGGILSSRKEPGVMLYSHNVLIQEYNNDLLPSWLSFVDGVVDSEDIKLNVSRETVQSNRIMRQLSKTVKKRVLRELKKLGDDKEKYATFWKEYSRAFKEGIATDPTAKEDLLPLFRYITSKSDGELASLDEYIERMAEEQEVIYYVMGDDARSVAHSPHLDPFKARDLEVVYWVDPLDALIASGMDAYKDKKFQDISDPSLELPEIEEVEDDATDEATIDEPEFNQLIGRFVTALGERVTEVRQSKVLKDNPVRLVAPEDTPNGNMDRLNRLLNKDYEIPQRVIEVNRKHPLIANLADLVNKSPDAPVINLTIEQLYDSALVQEGLHPDPSSMVPRIHELMQLAVSSN